MVKTALRRSQERIGAVEKLAQASREKCLYLDTVEKEKCQQPPALKLIHLHALAIWLNLRDSQAKQSDSQPPAPPGVRMKNKRGAESLIQASS